MHMHIPTMNVTQTQTNPNKQQLFLVIFIPMQLLMNLPPFIHVGLLLFRLHTAWQFRILFKILI